MKQKTAAETIHVRTEGRTGWVTLDRPPLNVLDIPMMESLSQALYRLSPSCDFIVFEGAGPKGFSAGVEVADHTLDRVGEMLRTFHGIFRQMWKGECFTIAAVHGYCLGGGCELATFCDFVVAGESAQFGQPEIRLGCFPPVAMVTFPNLVGVRAAADLICTGRTISAAEAHHLGLVTRVVPDAEVEAEVKNLLSELTTVSPLALRLSRKTLWRDSGMDFERCLREVEEIYMKELMKTEDAHEGIRAFLEKRLPAWKGR